MDRRAVVKTMNRVLDSMFSAPGYSRGAVEAISTGRRYYADDLKMLKEAGITEDQLERLFGFAQVSPTSQKMIRVLDQAQQVNQQPYIRNQKDLQQLRQLALTQHTNQFTTAFGNKYNMQDVKSAGYFFRLKQIMSNPAKLRNAMQSSFVQGNAFRGVAPSDPRIRGLAKQMGVIETGVGHNLKFIEELNKIGMIFDEHRAQTRASRITRSPAWNSISDMLNAMGGRSSSPYRLQTSTSQPLGPPLTNTSMVDAANSVVSDIYRRQALSKFQAPPTGFLDMVRNIAGANWPKVSGSPSVAVNRPKQSWFGRNKNKILDILMGVGGTGALVGTTAGIFGGMPFPMPFMSGGAIPRYGIGGMLSRVLPNINIRTGKYDPLFNINKFLAEGKAYYNDWKGSKKTYSLTKGKNQKLTGRVADIFNDIIVEGLASQYDPNKHMGQYDVLDPRMEGHVETFFNKMPENWRQAMAVATTDNPVLFEGFTDWPGEPGLRGRYYPSNNNILINLRNKKIQNTMQHEMAHLLYTKAPPASIIKSIKEMQKMGLKLDKSDYWKKPTEVLARAIGNRGKYAKGGIPRNPIRVSDGELAISKGLTDKIGLDRLRKINSGDMSALGGFSSGGMFEYNGPGTGTSDSILEDADKGPKGPDSSDVGFIIKRSSSDKLKQLLSGGINKVRGFWGGGNPFGGDAAAFSTALDAATRDPRLGSNFSSKTGRLVGFQDAIIKAINVAYASSPPTADIQDVLKNLFSDKTASGFLRVAGKTKGFPNTAKFVNPTMAVLGHLFGQQLQTDGQTGLITPALKGVGDVNRAMSLWIDSLNKSTIANKQNTQSTKDNTQSTRDNTQSEKQNTEVERGEYRGQLVHYPMRGTKFGETNVLGVVEGGGPGTAPLSGNVLGSQGYPPSTGGGLLDRIRRGYTREISGFWGKLNKELFSPTEMSHRVSGEHQFVIGGQYTSEEERSKMETNRKEFDTYAEDVMQRFRDQFGDVLGNLNLEDLVKVTRSTKKEAMNIITGYNEVEETDSSGQRIGMKYEPVVATVTREIGTLQTDITALESTLKGKMRPEEVTLKAERAMQLSPEAREGLVKPVMKGPEKKDIILIGEAETKMASFREEVKKTGMTGTLMYKFGDVMRGLSWRFASLSMSAMGVYFSIQGLLMTFQQGLAAIVTPLGDIEGLMKNIGMSTAFGDGIMNASKAMKALGVDTEDFIQSWKNITNIQGTIQTLFASIGSKVFGDKKFTDQLLRGITDAFKTLDEQGIGDTVKNLINSIVKAIPAILPAIQMVTRMLNAIADNPALVAMGAQLMVISLVLQPITSGVAALVTTIGGLATGINLFYSMSKALWAMSIAENAASLGFVRMAAGALLFMTAAIPLYEILANVINYTGLLGNFKFPTITGWVMSMMNPPGYAEGGVVQSQGYDMVPNNADDTVITAKSGEMVLTKDQQKALGIRQSFAAGAPLLPSMMYSKPAAEDTYQFSKTVDLATTGNRNTQQTARILGDVQNGDALNANIVNWPDLSGLGGMSGGFTIPNISSVIGTPYHLNPNMAFAPGNFNPTIPLPTTTSTTTTPQGTPVTTTTTTTTTTPTTNANQIPTNTGPSAAPTPTTIISDTVIGYISEAFKRAAESITVSVQDAVGNIHDGLMSSFDSIYSGLQSAGETIQNIVGGMLTFNVEDIKKGAQTVVQSASNFLYGNGQPSSFSISPNAIPTGAGVGYENIFYSHAGYNPIGTTGDYIRQRRPRQGYMNRWREGRYELPQMPPPPGRSTTITGGRTPGAGQVTSGLTYPRATDFWSNKELFTAQWQDMGEVARALASGDPIAVAKAYGSVLASNTLVGGAGRLLQYGAIRAASSTAYPVMGSMAARGLAHTGSLFTGANVLAGNPAVIGAAHVVESGEAFDRFTGGESLDSLMGGNFNSFTGLITGGASTALFGRGMKGWGSLFNRDEQQMREDVNKNAALFNFQPQMLLNPMAFIGRMLGETAKGVTGLSDFEQSGMGAIGGIPFVGGFINDIIKASKQGVNTDIGSYFGAGTGIFGLGLGAYETAGNTANMAMQNPWSLGYGALQAGLFGAVPIPGLSIATNLLSDTLMPQTSKWAQEQGYGVIDASKMGWRGQATAGMESSAVSLFDEISTLTDAIKGYTAVMEANQTTQQPVEVTVKLQIDGNQIINATELTEFITAVQKRNQPNATR